MNRRDLMRMAGALGIAGPVASLPGLARAQGGQLLVGVTRIAKPDPILNRWKSVRDIARQVCDSLLAYTPTGELLPALITQWEAVDATTWRLSVRENVTWHDGTPFTSEHVASQMAGTTDCCCDPKNDDDPDCDENKKDCPVDQMPAFPVRVSVLDRLTVEVEFDRPQIDFIRYLASPWNMMVKRSPDFTKLLIGTGPYKAVSIQPEVEVLLERNNDFWGEAPAFETIIFRDYSSLDSLARALEDGEIQIANQLLDSALADRSEGINVRPYKESALVMHLNLPRLGGRDDARARLVKASVRDVAAEAVPARLGRPAAGDFGSPWFTAFGGKVETGGGGDLCGLGFDDEITLALIEPSGSDSDLYRSLARSIAERLVACGLRAEIRELSWPEFNQNRQDFAAVLYRKGVPVNPLGLVDAYVSDPFSLFGEDFTQFAPQLAEFRSQANLAARQSLGDRIFRQFADISPIVPIARVENWFAYSNTLDGVAVDPFGDLDLRRTTERG